MASLNTSKLRSSRPRTVVLQPMNSTRSAMPTLLARGPAAWGPHPCGLLDLRFDWASQESVDRPDLAEPRQRSCSDLYSVGGSSTDGSVCAVAEVIVLLAEIARL